MTITSTHHGKAERSLTLGFLLAFVLSAMLPMAAFAGPPKSGTPGASALSKHDRELIATARVNGQTSVTLLVAAKRGKNSAAASDIQSLGGTIGFREDSIDYLRVKIGIDKVESLAKLSSVQAVDVNEVIPLEDPKP